MLECVLAHPELQDFRRWILATLRAMRSMRNMDLLHLATGIVHGEVQSRNVCKRGELICLLLGYRIPMHHSNQAMARRPFDSKSFVWWGLEAVKPHQLPSLPSERRFGR